MFSVLVVGVRVFRGFPKNNWVLASLVGSGITCACHVLNYSVNFNVIFDIGGNGLILLEITLI